MKCDTRIEVERSTLSRVDSCRLLDGFQCELQAARAHFNLYTLTVSSGIKLLTSKHHCGGHTHAGRRERDREHNTGRSNSAVDRLVHSLHLSSNMEGVVHKCNFTSSVIHVVHNSDSLLSSNTCSILGLYHLQVRDLAPSSGDYTDCNIECLSKESRHMDLTMQIGKSLLLDQYCTENGNTLFNPN